LLNRFDRNEGHRQAGSGLGDPFGITDIILVNLDLGLDEKRQHQSRLMAVSKAKTTDVDMSRFDAAPLIAFTAAKETDYGIETDGRIPR
jgi:hypothetical protein